MTRESDQDVSLEERGALANRAGADIFVSIHLNWIENRPLARASRPTTWARPTTPT